VARLQVPAGEAVGNVGEDEVDKVAGAGVGTLEAGARDAVNEWLDRLFDRGQIGCELCGELEA
jgi:hypothetical protein